MVTDGSVPLIFQLSYMYYATSGLIVGTLTAIIVSLMTGTQNLEKLDPDLIVPYMQRFLPIKPKPVANLSIQNEQIFITLNDKNKDDKKS